MGIINTQMKTFFTVVTVLFISALSFPTMAQTKPAGKKSSWIFGVTSSDYTFFKNVQDSTLSKTIQQKDWLRPAKSSFGVSVGYFRQLTNHIDFSGNLTGTFSSFSKNFVKADSIGQAGFTPQLDAMLHFRLLKNTAKVNPFLAGGIGGGSFLSNFAAYIPAGGGLQFNFNGGTQMLVQAQWRKALTGGISNDYLHYSLGFTHRANWTKKAKKEAPKKDIEAQKLPIKNKETASKKSSVKEKEAASKKSKVKEEEKASKKSQVKEKETASKKSSVKEKEDASQKLSPNEEEKTSKKSQVKEKESTSKKSPVKEVDSDGDGLADTRDFCPDQKGTVMGCPDSDKDGIADIDDACKNVAGKVAFKGCPFADTDNDGVSDEKDKCPTLAGTASKGGCPEIKEEVTKMVDEASKSIFFEFASDVIIMQKSQIALNKIINLLNENPELYLKIEAHADNQGSFGTNVTWSQKRAKAVADYFTKNKISPSRILFKGYGDTQPIADNKTSAGRAKNRRVEMIVHYKN